MCALAITVLVTVPPYSPVSRPHLLLLTTMYSALPLSLTQHRSKQFHHLNLRALKSGVPSENPSLPEVYVRLPNAMQAIYTWLPHPPRPRLVCTFAQRTQLSGEWCWTARFVRRGRRCGRGGWRSEYGYGGRGEMA